MAEYIKNGDFADGLTDWAPTGAVQVEPSTGPADNHVVIGAGAHIVQHWIMPEPHGRLGFSLAIKVEGGSDLVTGKVQVVFLFSGGGRPISATLNVRESSEWESHYLQIPVGESAGSGNIEVLVQAGFTNKVTITNISLMGETSGGLELEEIRTDKSSKK